MDVVDAYRATMQGGELTELALTPYDRTDIPVVATVFDDGVHDMHGVGYGASERAATVGALGELAERVVLAPVVRGLERRRASYAELCAELGAQAVADPLTLVLEAGSDYAPQRPLDWVPAVRWRTGEAVWLPLELVAFDETTLPGDPPPGGWLTTPITNGLGAGDSMVRAVGHGLLELVQRDGDTVSFRSLDQGVVLDVDAGEDPQTHELLARLRKVGIEPLVKLASSELAVVVYCVGDDSDPEVDPMAVGAIGEAAHPDRDVAVRKALLEYASSRARRIFAFGPLERVAALSPDYLAAELRRPLGDQEPRALREMTAWSRLDASAMRELLAPRLFRREQVVSPATLPQTGELDPGSLLALMLDRLADRDVLVVAGEAESGMVAAKVVVPGLEVETMSYLRIGERVATRLLERGSDLVGRGVPDRPGRLRVLLTEEATERVGGPLWLDRDAVARAVDAMYPLYREPRRHAVQRSLGAIPG